MPGQPPANLNFNRLQERTHNPEMPSDSADELLISGGSLWIPKHNYITLVMYSFCRNDCRQPHCQQVRRPFFFLDTLDSAIALLQLYYETEDP